MAASTLLTMALKNKINKTINNKSIMPSISTSDKSASIWGFAFNSEFNCYFGLALPSSFSFGALFMFISLLAVLSSQTKFCGKAE